VGTWLTGTVLDEVPSIGKGFGAGLVAVYDESEGYVAATEFCLRVCSVYTEAPPVWLDLRSHAPDVVRDTEVVVVRRGEWTTETVLDLGLPVMVGGLLVIDSLPALPDPGCVESMLAVLHAHAMAADCLVVVGNYARANRRAVAEASLNGLSHSVVCATHKGSQFGVRMPISRCKVPVHEWCWDEARIVVGQ